MTPDAGDVSAIQREFDALAPDYETNRLGPWYKAHAEAILAECPKLEDGDILDIGCGTGYLLRTFLARNPGTRGVGVDISPQMVAQGMRRTEPGETGRARFLQGDWESFDMQRLAGYSFRLAFCANAFHYFSTPRRAAERLYEALGDGGVLYVLERNKSDSLLTRFWGWLHRYYIKDNVEFYTLPELVSFFAEAGFAKVTVVRTINRLFWNNKLYTSVVLLKCVKS